MSRTKRRHNKKQLSLKERLRRFKEKQTRNLLAVKTWNRSGGGSHGDQRRAESRDKCRRWKTNKNRNQED